MSRILEYNGNMKGGDDVQLLVDKEKLDTLMKKAGFRNYRELAHEAKVRQLPLSEGTIYKMVDEATWTATRLAALCQLIGCKPADIIPEWGMNGASGDPHPSPQPAQELEAAAIS